MKVMAKGLAALILAGLIIFLSIGGGLVAFATTKSDEINALQVVDVTDVAVAEENEVTDRSDLAMAAEKFLEYLKDRYGEDYDYYYNKIIDEWGSIEGYLLAFGDKLPEEHKSGWDAFVGWLGEYSVVWAPAFVIVILIAVSIFGKKLFNKVVERIVNSKLSPVITELNLQSNALAKMLSAQKALLGNCEKFSDEIKELEKAKKELENG